MPDIQIEKEDKFKKLKNEQRDELANEISSWWGQWHDKRQSQLDTAKQLELEIFLNQPDRNKADGEEWKANIKENKLYTTWEAMKAGMWKEIWSNEAQMFDVVGVTKQYDDIAQTQKEALVHALKEMQAGVQFDIATDNWALYGDFIFKTDWKQKVKTVKRLDPYQGLIEQKLPLVENANIEAINPMFFNFDVTKYKYGDKDSWAKCPKIYKRFATIEEIKANPLYKLTKEQEAELNGSETTKTSDKKEDSELAKAEQYGNAYEVLYFQGDLKFNNVYYKNVVAEVLAGKYLILFDENPIYICPFVFDVTQRDPKTGRGISPLKCILEMSKVKEDLLNKSADVATLNMNPPQWGTDVFLKDKYKNGKVPYSPGGYLEYEASYSGSFPQAVKFDSSGTEQIISYLANTVSDTSAINANAMGNVEAGQLKATDLQLAKQGSDSRTAMRLDKIYQIDLWVVENTAELLAMFKPNPETILVKDKGQMIEREITADIRRGQYQYTYEDRNALIDRRAKNQEFYQALTGAAQLPQLAERIDWVEAFKKYLENSGFDNIDAIITEPSQVDQVADFVKQLPPQMQQAIMQNIQPMLQQAQMMIQQQGGMNGQR